MLEVNGKQMEWREDVTFEEIYRFLEYNLKKALVVIKVNAEIVKNILKGG